MAFFFIQNHEVPILYPAAAVSPKVIGDAARSFSGQPLSTRRAVKKDWTCTTAPLKSAYGQFLLALLNGQGHVWDYDSTTDYRYSGRGFAPTSGTSANLSRYTGDTKFGAGAASVAAGQFIQYNVNYDFEYTMMCWTGTSVDIGTHYIVNSQGHKWVDGVRNDAALTPFLTMSSGNFRLGDAASAGTQYFDDVAVIEADITADWAEDFGTMTTAFGSLPKLRCRGDLLYNHVYLVEAFEAEAKFLRAVVDGTMEDDLMEITFTLHESSRVG